MQIYCVPINTMEGPTSYLSYGVVRSTYKMIILISHNMNVCGIYRTDCI